MRVLVLVRFALLLAGVSISLCDTLAASTKEAPRPTPVARKAPKPRPAAWLLHPHAASSTDVAWGERDGLFQGIRLTRQANGVTQRSSEFINGSATGALRIPDAWGGGFVFHSDIEAETALWYAPTWLGPLRPLGRFAERADRVTLGFGRIYVRLGDSGETVALNIRDGHHTALGPIPETPGYFDLRFWDDWFAAANTDVRGVLVTFDAGASWHPTGITDESATFSIEQDGIGIRSGGEYLVLQPSGVWQTDDEASTFSTAISPIETLLDMESAERPALVPRPLGSDPVREAVLHGWPMAEGSAVIATAGSVGVVNLTTGETSRVHKSQYPGYKTCHATTLGKRTALLCPLTHDAFGVYGVAPDLTLQLLARWEHPVSISSNDGALLAHAACPGTAPVGAKVHVSRVCLMSPAEFRTIDVPHLNGREPKLVPLAAGNLAVVFPPTSGADGSFYVVPRGSSPSSARSPLRFAQKTDAKARAWLETGFWLNDAGTLAPGRLGFWVVHSNRLIGVAIEKDGTMNVGRRVDADVRRTHVSGARALELTSGEIAYQSTDFGQTWTELPLPRGLTASSTRNTTEEVGCSEVGCAFGPWLRVGYVARVEDDTAPNAETKSATQSARQTDLSRVPVEASLPASINYRPSAYSLWQLTCYPNGAFENASTGSAASTFANGQANPRMGSQTGFVKPVATPNGNELDLAPSAHRNFLGVKHPELPPGVLAFDMGDDGEHQFRAYTFGPSNTVWASNSSWLVRVADRFAVSGVWSTAPTRAPWPDLLSAAQLFGADRANRHSSSWQLVLDPSERAGALRINTSGTTELHFIEANTATTSIGGQSMGSLAGAVKINGVWHFGVQEGNRFLLYQLRQGAPVLVGSFPVSDFVHTTLIRNTHSSRIALLLRSPAGTWHIYPLNESFDAAEPLVVDRDRLNQQWPKCGDNTDGWVVVSALPLSRFTPSTGAEVLTFESDVQEVNAEAVVARTVVNPTRPCVEALAARLTSAHPPKAEPKRTPNTSNTIPLTLTDRTNDVRHGFQCGP